MANELFDMSLIPEYDNARFTVARVQDLDMLDGAFQPKTTSRLGYQAKLEDAIVKLAAKRKIEVSIPQPDQHNTVVGQW